MYISQIWQYMTLMTNQDDIEAGFVPPNFSSASISTTSLKKKTKTSCCEELKEYFTLKVKHKANENFHYKYLFISLQRLFQNINLIATLLITDAIVAGVLYILQ